MHLNRGLTISIQADLYIFEPIYLSFIVFIYLFKVGNLNQGDQERNCDTVNEWISK